MYLQGSLSFSSYPAGISSGISPGVQTGFAPEVFPRIPPGVRLGIYQFYECLGISLNIIFENSTKTSFGSSLRIFWNFCRSSFFLEIPPIVRKFLQIFIEGTPGILPGETSERCLKGSPEGIHREAHISYMSICDNIWWYKLVNNMCATWSTMKFLKEFPMKLPEEFSNVLLVDFLNEKTRFETLLE